MSTSATSFVDNRPQNGDEQQPHDDHETSPLLPTNIANEAPQLKVEAKKSWKLFVGMIFAIIVLIDTGSNMLAAPQIKLFEEVTCVKYWREHDPSKISPDGTIPEELCKRNEITDIVQLIIGWQGAWDVIPGLLLSVPYGVLADRWGRKPVLLLGILGGILGDLWVMVVCWTRAPLMWAWASALFGLMGGGTIVAASILLTMVADITPSDSLTPVFSILHAATIGAEMTGPLLSSWLMRANTWRPVGLGFLLQVFAVSGMLLVPETMQYRPHPPTALLGGEDNDREETEPTLSDKEDGLLSIFRVKDLTIPVLTFFFTGLSAASMGPLFLEYVSNRYGLIIADANLLSTLRAGANFLFLLLLLPTIPGLFKKYFDIGTDRANLITSKVCSVLLTISLLLIGLSSNLIILCVFLVIYVIGTGYHAPMRALATSIAGGSESHILAKLFTMQSLMWGLGSITAGPILPVAFALANEYGGIWSGIPYLFSAFLFGIMTVMIFFIRAPKETVAEEEADLE